MSRWIILHLRRLPAWPLIALLFIGFLLCDLGFDWRSEELGSHIKILDARGWYSPVDARDLFESLGEDGRRIYALTEVTLDLAFPLIYGTLFALLICQLYRAPASDWLILLPVISVMTDLTENSLLFYLAMTFNGQTAFITWIASIATATKTAAFIGSLFAILAGGIHGITTKNESQRTG